VLGAVSVGDDVLVGANAVVVEDVPAGATAVGVPARVVVSDVPRQRHPLAVASRRSLGMEE
jgi:serine O-acetyltransferase